MNPKELKAHFIRLLLILAAGSLVHNLHAQWKDIRFRHLSIEQGLSQSYAICIVQDTKGFIWIGTETGLNKYDGYSFTVYEFDAENPNSLSNNTIMCINKEKEGILWIGTENGLNRFDPELGHITRYIHDPDNAASISNGRIFSLCQDSGYVLWIGTENGLNKFDTKAGTCTRFEKRDGDSTGLSNNTVHALYRDRSGVLWIGTDGGGLNRFEPANGHFSWYKNNPADPGSISDNQVNALYEDRSGVLWVGTEAGGLNRFDREKGVFVRYKNRPGDPASISDNQVNAIYEDRSGRLWIGTGNGGLNVFDPKSERFFSYKNNPNNPYSLSNNRVLSIAEDVNGGLWFGTRGGGVNLFYRETHKFLHYKSEPGNPNSLSNNMIWHIMEDREGIVWIGTDVGGLNRFDRKTGQFKSYTHNPRDPNSISYNRVLEPFEDRSGALWIATKGGGLNRLDRHTEKFVCYKNDPQNPYSLSDNRIICIYEDTSGALWIGTDGGGLNRFDPHTERFVHYKHDPEDTNSLNCNRVFRVLEDRNGDFWVGTFGGGLNTFNRETGRFTQYMFDPEDPASLSNNFISFLHEDKRGDLWIATNRGLNKFNRSANNFTIFTKKNGLPDDVVYCILEDNSGNLWVSTNKGLAKLDPETGKIKNYDIQDGLQSDEFNGGSGCKCKNGEMLFGGINGFNSFFPDSLQDNPFIPYVVITDFQISNKSVPIGEMPDGRLILSKSITETKEITLSYKDNVFSFEFAALHYIAPEKNQFAYIMQGLERTWNNVGNRRFVSYTGIPAGTYLFKVKASNNDGVWNNEGVSLKIKIIPPFWKTWWFYTSCIVALIMIIVAVFFYQLNRLKQQKLEEEQRKVTEIFNRVLEQGDAVVYRRSIDSDTYDYMGESIKKITGYSTDEMTFSFWNKIIIEVQTGSQLQGLSLKEINERIGQGVMDRMLMDIKIKTKTGDIRWIRDMTTALRDESGACYRCFGILFDITDRKFAEQELARTSEELRVKNEEMEKDLNMAREIQMALLSQYQSCFPKDVPVEQSALHFLYRYIPASTLGGDFFEIFPVSNHEIGIIIYDVMGHGVRASLLTAYLHGLIENLLPIAADPVAFMRRLNIGLNAVAAQYDAGIFATAFYMVADIKTGKMRYTNAGHPMPFILRPKTGIVEKLQKYTKKSEPALGLIPDFDYTFSECPMNTGDIVLFYTDGIYEVDNSDKKLFGEPGLLTTVKNQLHVPFGQMLDGILSEIKDFAGTDEFRDDVCIVGMHVK